MSDFFSSSFSYSFGTYDASGGFNSIGGSGYAGQNISYQGTNAAGFDAFTSNPFVTTTTTTGFTFDQSIVGAANYQIGVDYTNNAVYGFANPSTGGAQALSLDNTYYNIQAGSDAYLTTQFNKLGSIAVIQTETATVIRNTLAIPLGVEIDDAPAETFANEFELAATDTAGYPGAQVELQLSLDSVDKLLDFLYLDEGGIGSKSSIETSINNGITAQSVLNNFGQQLTNQQIEDLSYLVNSALGLAAETQAVFNIVSSGVNSIRSINASDSDSPQDLSVQVQQAATSLFDSLTRSQVTILESLYPELDAELATLLRSPTLIDNPFASIANLNAVPYTANSVTPFTNIDAQTQINQAVAAWIAGRGTINEEQYDAIANFVIQSRAIQAQNDAVEAINFGETERDRLQNVNLNVQPLPTAIDDPFAGGGGASGPAEVLEPVPVNTTVDVQAGGAGEETISPGDIDFGPVAVSTIIDPQAGNNNTTTNVPTSQIASVAVDVGGEYTVVYNSTTGTYDVINASTDTVVLAGLTQNQANVAAADYSAGRIPDIALDAPVRNSAPAAVTNAQDPSLYPNGLPYDDDGNLNPGWTLDENNNPVFVGGDFVEPATQASAAASIADASRIQALKNQANSQATIAAQRKQANEGDWRVKLRLAEGADYLYRDPKINENGVLWPLTVTNGVVFPYTPQISTNYAANYNQYDLTHSNYRGYFYQNSYVDEVNITATFTAQDTSEANYMLAVIHFFRSVTKMFYGQDANRGQPPPLVFLQGLGEFQFNLHPCLVRGFSYNLPNDVDYIRARTVSIDGTNLLGRRDRANLPSGPSWLSNLRLGAAGLQPGGVNPPPAPPTLGTTLPTYVPTKLDMTITLLPTQTRSQVSKQFSLKQFANGDLVKGGFW
jgi:hypothetical protein